MALPDVQDPRWLDYLFYRHPPAELRAWGQRLRYFRFCKAIGGHANDGDNLLVALRYTDAADLGQLLTELGLPIGKNDSDLNMTASLGRSKLAGQPVYISLRHLPVRQLEIVIFDQDNVYEVTSAAITAAETVEVLLAAHEPRIIDPPLPNFHCVCPAYYPELWAEPLPQKRASKRRKLTGPLAAAPETPAPRPGRRP